MVSVEINALANCNEKENRPAPLAISDGLPRPDCAGRRANEMISESGTAERSGGRMNDRERFFQSLSDSLVGFGIVEVETYSVGRLE